MTEMKAEPVKYGAQSSVAIYKSDKTANVGKLTTELGRKLATMLATQFAQDPRDYYITITVTMEESTV